MIYEITEQSLSNCYDIFSRELNSLHNNNNNKAEDDEKVQKELQKKISILNAILNNLNKLKPYYKIK